MPDGPVVALAVLVVGLVILAIGFFIARLRHPQRGRHQVARTAPRLPLFGTDLLVVRTGDDIAVAEDVPAASDRADVRAAEPVRAVPPAARPAAVGANGSGRARETSPFAPPAPAAAPADAPRPSSTPPRPGPAAPPARESRPAATRPASDRPGAPRAPLEFRTAGDTPPRPAPAQPAFAGAAALAAVPTPAPAAKPAAHPEPSDFVDGQSLRFAIPTDGTLQFLPGRLEVIDGPDTGREIRFVRLPGETTVDVTFGRTTGPAYSHVQLHARTVSRRHAVMSLIDDHWQLQNHSTTNPVVLNGRSLAPDEVAPLLVDGDRIEMGEIVFVFRSR